MSDQTQYDVDPDILSAIREYSRGAVYSLAPLSTRTIHELGLKILEAGRYAEAEMCLRLAREKALHDDPDLCPLINVDLAACLPQRFPSVVLRMLSRINIPHLPRQYQFKMINTLGGSLECLCDYTIANKLYVELLRLASADNDHVMVALSHANCATILFEHGSYEQAEWCNNEAVGLFESHDQATRAGLALTNMGVNAMHRGNYDESMVLFDRAGALNSLSPNAKLAAYIKCNIGEAELLNGDVALAYEFLTAGEIAALDSSLPFLGLQAFILKAIIEEKPNHDTLIVNIKQSLEDLASREAYREAGSIVCLISVLNPLDIDNDLIVSIMRRIPRAQAQTLIQHYKHIIDRLQKRSVVKPSSAFGAFISNAPSILAMKESLEKLVDTDVRILLEGESGTGKSFLARQIHQAGRSQNAPWVVVDCTNLEENLFESKLFGHLRGSFTGAVADTIGLVEQANGGTLFLDEIGELPTEVQGKLLYVIEEQRYRPVGAKSERRSNFRVIAATNRDLDQMLEKGELRRDLFFRLAGFRVHIPPLSQRREDIVPLAEHRLQQLNTRYGRRKTLRHIVWEALLRYTWPGNVRELNTTLERGYHLSPGRRIGLDDLALGLTPLSSDLEDLSWYSVRREHLLRVLRLCRGNVSRAAQLLGLNRTTLIYKLKLLNVTRQDFDPNYIADSADRSSLGAAHSGGD